MENRKSTLYTVAVTVIITACLSFLTITTFYSRSQSAGEKKFSQIMEMLDRYYYDGIDEAAAYEGAIAGAVNTLGDPYTEYLPKRQYEQFTQMLSSSYCGIGVTVQDSDGYVLVVDVFEGSPAAEAGIEAGDLILDVDGVEAYGAELDLVTQRIQGEEGTTVELGVWKSKLDDRAELTLQRRQIATKSVSSSVIEGIGYLELSVFGEETGKEFEEQLQALVEQDVSGLIVDLRNNGGGLTTAAEEVLSCLLSKGDVLYYTADKNGKTVYYKSQRDGVDLPLVVLANGNSASASEIVIGAVKDHGRGLIVGEKSFGKGVVQQVYTLDDGSAVKITVEHYFTPNGNYIQDAGIEPDYLVEQAVDAEEDVQLQRALELLKK